MFGSVFAAFATGFTAQYGSPYFDGTAVWPGMPTYDSGGSIIAPGTSIFLACKVQFDTPTQEMRNADGFLQSDARLIVLASSIFAPLDSLAVIEVAEGPNAGKWELLSCVGDSANIGYECRGRLCR